MLEKPVLLTIVLAFCLMSSAQAANIIWVTETGDTDGDGVQDDLGFIDLLEAQGHTIDARYDHWMALDEAKIKGLNAADLVIISRRTNSAHYDESGEPEAWNSLKTPMILLNAYFSRSSRWRWINSTSYQNLMAPAMEVLDPEHPIFRGVALDMHNEVAALDETIGTGQASFMGTTDLGSGYLLAIAFGNTWIAEWEAGVEFYTGSGQTPAGHRLLLCGGTQQAGATAQGAYNFTEQGEKIFLNAIRYMLGAPQEYANNPVPPTNAHDIPQEVALSWIPGVYAAKHDVYLGSVFENVSEADRNDPRGVLVSQNQDGKIYDPAGALDFGQTYCWRVDEVNGAPDHTIFKGEVWSFTVEPFAYPIENIVATASGSSSADLGPEKTVDGSGLDGLGQHSTIPTDMWLSTEGTVAWIQYEFTKTYKLYEMRVWNSNQIIESFVGLSAKEVTIETSTDGLTWTQLDDVREFAQAPGSADYISNTTVDFKGVLARFVRMTIHSGYGMMSQYGLSEVRFLYIPTQARAPRPASGQTIEGIDVALEWRAGREAVSHQVVMSPDLDAVTSNSAVVGTVSEAWFVPVALDYRTTYYWRINEIDRAETPGTNLGDVWSFTTGAYSIIDDFEQYNDDCGAIFYSWRDGLGYPDAEDCNTAAYDGNGSGAMVGYDNPPFAENTVTFPEGGQSMPLLYDNALEPYYSEVSSADDILPPDWFRGGAEVLALNFRGRPAAFRERDGIITLSGAGADIWGQADEFRYAWKPLSGDGALVARIESLTETHNWVKAGVMIRDTLDPNSIFAGVYMTGAHGVSFQARRQEGTNAERDAGVATHEQQMIAGPAWLKIERMGNQIKGYYAIDEAGNNWTPMAWNPQRIRMQTDCTIGLAVTSHSPTHAAVAEFSAVSASGGVTGAWQVEDVGVDTPSNEAAPLYVVLEDSAGRSQRVTHPDPDAVLVTDFKKWQIPLSEFSKLDLSNIKTLTIGVGDRDHAQPGGMGRIYIDNIRVGRPTAE